MDDLISRQAAIDWLNDEWDGIVLSVFDGIRALPSAQPDSKDLVEKIKNGITASDGNSEYFIGLRNGMRWCLSLIDDKEPIYESSAQPDLDSAYTEGYTAAESKYRKMWDEMQANIKAKAFGKRKGLIHTADIDFMHTIEPERKTGKWERHYSRPNVYADLCWHCFNCGYKTPDNWANKWKFCPNCGARMVQEGEDNDS